MGSPFVEKESHTYKYPDPFDAAKEDETAEQLAAKGADDPDILRRIKADEVDVDHWVTIRIPRSSRDVDGVADATQSMVVLGDNGDGTRFEQRIAHGNASVFERLVEAWSFDAEPNAANYERLTLWAGDWVRACLADAIKQGTTRDFVKKTKVSSPQLASSPSSSVSSQEPELEQ